jgi:hypothetical protein
MLNCQQKGQKTISAQDFLVADLDPAAGHLIGLFCPWRTMTNKLAVIPQAATNAGK